MSSGVRAVHIRVGGLDDQAATMRHRVDRVDDEVHEHLLHLVRIDSDLSEVRVQRGHQLDVLPDQAPDDGLEVAHHVVQAQDLGLEHLLAAEGEQLSRQRGRSVRALLDQLDVGAARMLTADALEHELRAAGDHGQEVVEVVGDASGEPADRLHLLRLELGLELRPGLRGLHTLGDVPERDDGPGDPPALPERRGHVVDGHGRTVVVQEHLGLQIAGLAVRAGAVDRRRLEWCQGAVRRPGEENILDGPADELAARPAEDPRPRGVHERDDARRVHPADSVDGRVEDQLRVGLGRLVGAPGHDHRHAGGQHEARVDERPRPRAPDRGRVVVDGSWIENADDPVMEGDVRDRAEEGDPALVERDDAEHHEEMEVHLDVAAREVGEHGGRRDQTQARDERAKGAAQPRRGGAEPHRCHHASLDQAVDQVVSGREREGREGHALYPEQDENAPVATAPDPGGQ